MNHFWGLLGWIWSKKGFVLISCAAAVFFFGWMFPLSDLSDVATSQVAMATGNKVYAQFESLDLSWLPTPGVSAKGVVMETPALPPLEAKWIKLTPSFLNLLVNSWTIKKAMSGDPEASQKLGTRLSLDVSAEGVLGGDIDFLLRPGSKSEQGLDRSKVSVFLDDVNLGDVQKWKDLPLKMSGTLGAETSVQYTPTFQEQPEADFSVHVEKFTTGAGTIMVPIDDQNSMPINIPALSLKDVVLKGRLVGGALIIEEAVFGANGDPIHGRIKGQMGLRLQPMGGQIFPQFGAYNLTVELNATRAVEKEIGFLFLLFMNAKTATETGSRYLFRANGENFGPPPQVTPVQAF